MDEEESGCSNKTCSELFIYAGKGVGTQMGIKYQDKL